LASVLLECPPIKNTNNKNIEDMGENEHSYTVGGKVNSYSNYGIQSGGTSKTKNTTVK
jgi:hypothetical protein